MEEDIRHMLMKSGLGAPPPPSLDIVIMQKIKAEQDRRIYRKVVVYTVLKVLALFALLVIFGVALWGQASRLDWAGAGDRITTAGLWVKEHVYFVLGGMIAVIFAGVFKFGRA